MSRLNNFKIHTKFNLLLSLLLITLFLAAAMLTYQRQEVMILKFAVDNARGYANQIIKTREYMSEAVSDEPENNYALVPQVVASQVAKKITSGSKYYVRQVSLRNRNPENRPDQYETDKLELFIKGSAQEVSNVITENGTRIFRYMQPMVANQTCLECHGDYEKAPRFVRDRFPKGHSSYNYKIGEIIGAVSVSIPMVDLYHEIGVNLKLDLVIRAVIFFSIILIVGFALRKSIIDPIKLLSDHMVKVTLTGNFVDRLPKTSNDEIGELIGAFNDLMIELDRKTIQSKESEERYRAFIELLHAAVITFMEDGKILITNQKAEEFLDRSRHDLLGESIYDYLVDGEAVRDQVATFIEGLPGHPPTGASLQVLKSYKGKLTTVEMLLSSSLSGEKSMLTALLREAPR
jgi:PAS domain S-box-containing protein